MTADQETFHHFFDQLTAYFSRPDFSSDLAQARGEYFDLINPVPPDGPLYESRLALFLDWFLFDRRFRNGKSACQYYYEICLSDFTPDEKEIYRGFLGSNHSIFLVRKIHHPEIELQDLVDQQVYTVEERRNLNVQVDDLCDCRLLPFHGSIFFSGAFCYHPREVLPFLRKLLKPVQKKHSSLIPVLVRLVSLNNTWNLHYPHADPREVYESYGT